MMKVDLTHLFLVLTLMVLDVVTAQTEQEEGDPLGIIVLVVIFFVGILCGFAMYKSLMDKDHKLPADQKYMTDSMQCLFWFLCICFGLICGLIFYVSASNEMDTRLRRINMQPAIAEVPMQVVPAGRTGDKLAVEEEVLAC